MVEKNCYWCEKEATSIGGMMYVSPKTPDVSMV